MFHGLGQAKLHLVKVGHDCAVYEQANLHYCPSRLKNCTCSKSDVKMINVTSIVLIFFTLCMNKIFANYFEAHLLSASVMSAPAALASSKLLYPEREESQLTSETIRCVKI